MVDDERSSLDTWYRCVADARRRCVLSYLQDADDGVASLDDLVDHVVEEVTTSSAPDREHVAIDLYHVQLPLLADHGMIDFDARTATVRDRTEHVWRASG